MIRSVAVLLALLCALPAQAQDDPVYLDDGSTPELLVRSFFNAISRYEHGRAWSYLNPEFRPDYEAFRSEFEAVERAEPIIGFLHAEGRADAVYYDVPVIVRVIGRSGEPALATSCLGVVWPLNDLQGTDSYRMPYVNYAVMSPVEAAAGTIPMPTCY